MSCMAGVYPSAPGDVPMGSYFRRPSRLFRRKNVCMRQLQRMIAMVTAMRRFGLWSALICLLMAVVMAGCPRRLRAQDENAPGIAGGQMVRGTVTSATADHIAVRTEKGDVYQIVVTDNSRIMKKRQAVKVAEIKAGDNVGAMGVLDAPTKTVHAVFVMVVDAAEAQKAREDLGKVYIAGRVTAIDELKLTIQRPDGVAQVIAVDESTSFRKGGRRMQSMIEGVGEMDAPPANGRGGRPQADAAEESITLADIKVGNTVAGKGGLKGGIFVPSELAISDGPPRSGQGRRRPDRAGAGTAPAAASGPQG
jgi:hypothetical protein